MYLIITFIGFIISLFLYFFIPLLKEKHFIYFVSILGAASAMWGIDFIVKGINEGWNTLFSNDNNRLLLDSLFGLGTVILVAAAYFIYLLIANRKKR